MIDPHVHCRDGSQSYKETIGHALGVAGRAGLSAIFDMPNTDPPITTRQRVEERLDIADRAMAVLGNGVVYGLYVGITPDPEQVKEAVACWKDFFPRVVGLKMFAGRSVGDMTVIKEEEQQKVYEVLAGEGFTGVLAVHCEKEHYIKPGLWNPANPRSHSLARPPVSEIASIEDQIFFALKAGFNGVLHIAHISVPDSVALVAREQTTSHFQITCGATPHHCMLSYEDIPDSKEGLLYKVNPPLRNRESRDEMLTLLKKGFINWIESDHAPHTLNEKLEQPYLSGFPGLPFYPHFIMHLRKNGFSEEQIRDLTHRNICKTFGIDIKLPEISKTPKLELHWEYEVDVYINRREQMRGI